MAWWGIAFAAGPNYNAAIDEERDRVAREAIAKGEDELPYTEPPAWWRPARHVLGAVLVDAGRADAAGAVYREDLRRNPENGWALLGLSRSLRERNPAEAAAADARFRKAWTSADVQIGASRP